MIPTIQELRVRIQKFTDPSKVAGLRSQMNRVILTCLSRRGPTMLIASPLEDCRDGIMATFPCHSDQAVAIVPVPFRVRFCIEQHLNNLGVSFADGEVDRRRIEIAATAQRSSTVTFSVRQYSRSSLLYCGTEHRLDGDIAMSLLDHPEAQALLDDAEVSADDVRGCRDHIARFLKRYLPMFYREEQRGHAAAFVRGLPAAWRKSVEPIAAQAAIPRKDLQFFVGCGGWDDETVIAELRRHVAQELAEPDGVIVLDPSSFPKKGQDSCGVARQWCGRLGKKENCQVGVFLAYVSSKGHAPLDRRLYLPKDWADDPDRRERCHVPADVTYRKTWEIAHDLLRRRGPGVPHDGSSATTNSAGPRSSERRSAPTASGTCSTCRATPTSATSTAAGRRARGPRGPEAEGAVRAGRHLGAEAAGRPLDPPDDPRR